VTAAEIEFLANWEAKAEPSREIAYMPARVLMQDFTGVPAVVDLAAMRDAIKTLGGDPERVNPLAPVELVIDHSVQVDEFGSAGALAANTLLEFQRNRERYAFLKWGQTAFRNFSAVPPGWASATRSIWSTWRVSFSLRSLMESLLLILTRWSAPTRIPP